VILLRVGFWAHLLVAITVGMESIRKPIYPPLAFSVSPTLCSAICFLEFVVDDTVVKDDSCILCCLPLVDGPSTIVQGNE
jgi:hypothetical protein